MALSVVDVLEIGGIDQNALAETFARRFADEPFRGYPGGAMELLRPIGTVSGVLDTEYVEFSA